MGYDHARVVRAPDGWRLEVVAGSDDTYVNDEPVSTTHTLRPGDVIRIGPARLRFEAAAEAIVRCTSCGNDNPDEFPFCIECGSRIDMPGPRQVEQDRRPPRDDLRPVVRRPCTCL